MNDSNNNIFGDSNNTSLPQNGNSTGVNLSSQSSHSVDSVNSSTVNTNSILDFNLITNPSQQNQNTPSVQSQSNINSQMNNSVFNNNISSTSVNLLSVNDVNAQPIVQSNLNMNGSDFSQNSNSIEVNSTLQPGNSVNSANSSTVNANYGFETNSIVNPSQINQGTPSIQPQNNVNSQINNNVSSNISSTSVSQGGDDELLKVFIGNNYEKITTRAFNFAGFFFTTFYMFYRKMFGYGLLVFLLNLIVLNVINNFVVTLAFNVAVGLLVNKIYLSYAKKKITVIKASNSQKSMEELKSICSTKGGTSVGQIFLGLVAELGIAFVVIFVMTLIGIDSFIGGLFNFGNWNITTIKNGSKSGDLVENVHVNGYSCIGSKCSVTIANDDGNSEDYSLGIDNSDFFSKLGDYKDYVKLNIYYNQKGNDKTIVDYKIFLKSSDEDITSVKTENELRDKIGLYSIGTHTDSLTLKTIGITGFGYDNDNSYAYTEYTFVDSKNNEYEMKYINNNDTLDLTEGQNYNVTFEVSEGTFDYEFTIKSIN